MPFIHRYLWIVLFGALLCPLRALTVNVKDYGAYGDGVHDDTAAMQLAHNTGELVLYPAGTYRFTTITLSSGGIIGEGPRTILHSTNVGNENLITCTGSGETATGIFRDFYLDAPHTTGTLTGDKSGGAGILIAPSSTLSRYCDISRVAVRYVPTCVRLTNASLYRVRDCDFFFYKNYGVFVSNDANPDQGDSCVYGCQFFNGSSLTVGYAIWQENSGGLKITGNKFNGGAGAYLLNVTKSTSDLLFSNNSVENTASVALNFNNNANNASNSVMFVNIVITGNQFAYNGADIAFNSIANANAANYWDTVSICGNAFTYHGTTNSVSLVDARNFIIEGNAFMGNSLGYRGIYVGGTCLRGKIGTNQFMSLTQSMLVQSTDTLAGTDIVTGSSTATTSTALGSLCAATVTVTYSRTFESAPVVTANAGSGGLSVALETVTAKTFSAKVIGPTSGASVPFTWSARGILRSY